MREGPPSCACGRPPIIRYRVLPRTDREPISEAARRARGGPYDAYACDRIVCRQTVRDSGSVLAVEPLGDSVVRTVRG